MLKVIKSNLESIVGLIALGFIVIGLGFSIYNEPRRIAVAQENILAIQLDEAMTLYAENCAICHGAKGEGIGAYPPLDGEVVRQIPYEELTKIITVGRYNTAMPAWGEAQGGSLNEYQISELVALLKAGDWNATQQRVESLGLSPRQPLTVEPDAAKMAQVANLPDGELLTQAISLYADYCISCHGADGLGTSIAPALNSAVVREKDLQELYRAITLGIPGTLMAGWQRVLSESEINSLVLLIQEWDQVPAGVLPMNEVKVELSASAIAEGEGLYTQNCSRCHGPQGQGTQRGPALNIKSFLNTTSDGAIQQIIQNGVPGTAMLGWADRLSETEILALVAFLRNWEADAPEVSSPVRMMGGGPPWLSSAQQTNPSNPSPNTPIIESGSMNSERIDQQAEPSSQLNWSELIRQEWRVLLLAVGVLWLAFFFVFSALSGGRYPLRDDQQEEG